MRLHCFNNLKASFFLIVLLLPIQVFAEQKIMRLMDEVSFNKLWNQKCTDIGERTLEPYFVTDKEHKELSLNHFLKKGSMFLVSDNFFRLGIKCYRNYGLRRVIVKKGDLYPVAITRKEDKKPYDVSTYGLVFDAYKDFLTTYNNQKIDTTIYMSRSPVGGDGLDIHQPVNFIFFNIKGIKYAIKHINYSIRLYRLFKIDTNTYSSKLVSHTDFEDMFLEGNLQYKFTAKGLMIKMEAEKNFYYSAALSILDPPPNDMSPQLKYIATSNNQLANIRSITAALSRNLNYFIGRYAINDKKNYSSYRRKQWLLRWIKQTGYLTTESGKKKKIPNIKRLEIWITRYLSKHRIKLIKGKTYYFSRDLSHYMIMDFYKSSGDPIYKIKPKNPCLRYKHLDPNVCRY